MQGVSAQTGASRQAGTGSLLTIDQHVAAQDAGRVEGSAPWALSPSRPFRVVHTRRSTRGRARWRPTRTENLSGRGWERELRQKGLSLLWALRSHDPQG